LDLDHLGAEIGEHLGERVAGDEAREIEDSHALERAARLRGVIPAFQSGHQSTFAPDSLTTRPHFACSAARNAANCAGDPPSVSPPSLARRSRTSFAASARFTSALSFAITGAGVPAGASSPYQVFASNPGKPDSATVGTAGSSGERFAEVTASARSLPLLTCA